MNIELTKQIDATPEQLFRALTGAGELVQWLPSSAESDPRTGGDYVLRFEFEDTTRNHTYSGQYEDVTANERVRDPWNGRFGDTTVEFTLKPDDGGTALTLVHSGWSDQAEEARQLHEQGWAYFLDNLDRHLTGGEDQRAAAGQKTGPTAAASTTGGP